MPRPSPNNADRQELQAFVLADLSTAGWRELQEASGGRPLHDLVLETYESTPVS